MTSATLVVSCPDRPGIVSALARLLHSQGANITQSDQYSDSADGMFFQRVCFDLIDPQAGLDSVRDAIATAAEGFGMAWTLDPGERVAKVAMMVSRFKPPDWLIRKLSTRQPAINLTGHPRSKSANWPSRWFWYTSRLVL